MAEEQQTAADPIQASADDDSTQKAAADPMQEEADATLDPHEEEVFDVVPLKRAFRNSLFTKRLAPRRRHADLLKFLRLLSKTIAVEL